MPSKLEFAVTALLSRLSRGVLTLAIRKAEA
jgi:hypothetical protein